MASQDSRVKTVEFTTNIFNEPRQITVSDAYDTNVDVVLFDGDCSELLKSIPSDSVDLIITSPPYNIGKKYEKKTSLASYLKDMEPVIVEVVRVLATTGSLCWQVGNYVQKGEVFPLDIYFYEIFKRLDLKLRNRIIWRFNHGLHCTKRFSGRYETILWFTKDDEYVFNLDPVRVPAKYPGKRHFKGPKKGQLSGNPLGKNPSDIWDVVKQDWEEGVWDIPNVKANHPEKTEHPCQFPVELVQRCVLALTQPDGVVLDPYCGVGSTIIAALQYNRKAMAAEQDSNYLAITRERIQKFAEGTLPLRPLGKPIHQPTKKERAAQMPLEWK
ncbi:site-specific DNA-methyltransferase [Candidatus Poribacteria bacterium]|nr:site-specific DNA-methyltransferase [Candidatus Poribacteria bacterium]MYA55933.1 site-specific DNA-methyltransferase [Candidatus Poribacteria bacterium]